jgi:hypothetical protein
MPRSNQSQTRNNVQSAQSFADMYFTCDLGGLGSLAIRPCGENRLDGPAILSSLRRSAGPASV